jgi:hypothetical protein
MRQYVIVILLLLPFSLRAQPSAVVKQGRWVSADLSSVVFRNDQVLDAVFEGTPEHSNYVFNGDTLVLVKNYYSSVDDFAFQRSDSAQFLIKTVTARQLVLVPANTHARNLARRAEYRFDNLQYIPAEKIKLKMLTMSYANDSAPNWQLSIDRHGNAAFSGTLPAQNQAGKFNGKLNKAQLDTLQQLLQHSLLQRLSGWHQNVALSDVPELTLAVTTADGKTYRLQSQVIPANLERLVDFILSLPQKLTLTQQPR